MTTNATANKRKFLTPNLPWWQGQFAGVALIEQMGTTGLVAWVLGGKSNGLDRWQRFKLARAVIVARGQSQDLFAKAVIATAEFRGVAMSRLRRATTPQA